MKVLEQSGAVSAMRSGMFLCIFIAGYIAIAGVHLDRGLLEITGLVATFLGAGVGGKVVQKKSEV